MSNNNSNLDRIKPFYIITVKIKTLHKIFLANVFEPSSAFIHFKGIEIADAATVNSLESALALFAETDMVEKYYPWTSVAEVDLKRFLKKE